MRQPGQAWPGLAMPGQAKLGLAMPGQATSGVSQRGSDPIYQGISLYGYKDASRRALSNVPIKSFFKAVLIDEQPFWPDHAVDGCWDKGTKWKLPYTKSRSISN